MTTMDIDKTSEKSYDLGLKYAEVRHQASLIAKDEDVRRQKVQVALLKEENGRLKQKASQLDDRIAVLAAQYEDAQLRQESLDQKCREQDSQLRAHVREQSSLRAELMSLSNATHDSTKVLTEKLALTRELAMLKPEVEHLRSQLAHQKDVLAEKLALERQLNTLEVELANEKRAAQRAAQRQASDENAAEEGLQQQIQDLEKKLAAEKRAREKTQQELDARGAETNDKTEAAATAKLQSRIKDLEKDLADAKRDSQVVKKTLETEVAEARGQIDVFELRVGDLKSKLREVREELKSARAELSAATAASSSVQDKPARGGGSGVSVPTKEGAPAAKKTKAAASKLKRKAEEPSGPELILQTPGIANEGRTKRPLKKRGFDPSAAVQKSTFSITPFLNKTSSLMDETSEPAAPAAAANASQQTPSEQSANAIPAAVEAAAAPEDESELPEDSILGRRMSASGAMLSAVDIAESSAPPIMTKAAGGEAPKRRGRPAKEKVLGDAPVSRKNLKAQAAEAASASAAEAPIKKARAQEAASGERLTEQENHVLPSAAAPKAAALKEKKNTAAAAKPASEAEPKKKKRKILGASSKTVFDEDDDMGDGDDMVAARPIQPTAAAASAAAGGAVKRPVKALGGGGRTAGGAANKRTMLGGMRNAFGGGGGGFSPLKRDRRGVNASFLA